MLITLKRTLNKKLKLKNEVTRICEMTHTSVKLFHNHTENTVENHEIIKIDENIGKQLNCAEVVEMI